MWKEMPNEKKKEYMDLAQYAVDQAMKAGADAADGDERQSGTQIQIGANYDDFDPAQLHRGHVVCRSGA
jgi:hypothetical protein